MNRSELVHAIAERTGVTQKDVDASLKGFYEVVAGAVAQGEKITVPGFLSFEQTERGARKGRNPATGEAIDIAASKGVKVSAGTTLKAIAAGKQDAP